MVWRLFDGRYGWGSKLKIVVSYCSLLVGVGLLILAIINFNLDKFTQMDYLRIFMGLCLGYIGIIGILRKW
ncbi:MAG: hypothetical protein AB7V77_04790 [Candidatus Woesearchaeota archaeon]